MAAYGHEIATSPHIGELLKTLKSVKLTEEQKAVVKEISWRYERMRRLPADLVEEFARTRSEAHAAWEKAREKDNFAIFEPHLTKIVELSIKMGKALDPDKDPYENLVAEYEPGIPLAEIRKSLNDIKERLKPLIAAAAKRKTVNYKFMDKKVPAKVQEELCRDIAACMGFDFSFGRLDVSTHPFTSNVGDVRITTAYNRDWKFSIGSTIHETGHALYEQGLPREHFGTPLGQDRNMSIHESQSRLWENHVGGGKPFWKHWFPIINSKCGLKTDFDSFYRAINAVKPGLIRIQSDELTYPMHIILRFELEDELIHGRIKVKDLPSLWRKRMKELVGIEPATDRDGVLQDVHWSAGLFGYFPTYTIGSMIAAQLYAAALRDIPDLEKSIAKGDCKPLLSWLRERIHNHGRRYSTKELVRRATGKEPCADDYVAYLAKKFGAG